MNEDDQSELTFEMDDDTAMADFMGDNGGQTGPDGKTKAPLPVSNVAFQDDLSMEDLLAGEDFDEPEEETPHDETTSFPNGILEESLPVDMRSLMDAGSDPVEGMIDDIRLDGATVIFDDGANGWLSKEEFGDWSEARAGDRVRASRTVDGDQCILLNHEPAEKKTQRSTVQRLTAAVGDGDRFVIDGSNVCRSYMESKGSFLAPLLTLVCTICEHGGDAICVFDGNERYELAKNSREPDSHFIYETLLTEQSRRFIEAPSTGPADDCLLKIAHRERLPVISNDRFDKATDHHQQQYPWLVPGGSRLLRGQVNFLTLVVQRLRLEVPLETDLAILMNRLRRAGDR